MAHNRKPTRRGALLIVVLSILVLFALIALTFVVVAGSFNRSAKAAARIALTDDEGQELIERAFLQLVRGSTDTRSAINDVDTSVSPAAIIRSQNLLEDLYGIDGIIGTVSAASVSGDFVSLDITATSGTLSQYWCFYAGRVLTMVTGSGRGLSARIVHSQYAGSTHSVVIEMLRNPAGTAITPANGDSFIINGRPFSAVAGVAANEDWDAPDAMNPFLAFVQADAMTAGQPLPPTVLTAAQQLRLPIPSFIDRPAIWDTNASGVIDAGDTAFINPTNANLGPRVVDNDRDGTFDSVWVDFGLPIKTMPDGTRCRPLVAVMCQDLDGRININAHGSLAQTAANYTAVSSRNWSTAAGGPTSKSILPRGMGAGPADIHLGAVVTTGSADYTNILNARYSSADAADFVPGARFATAGIDMLYRLQTSGIPDNYGNQTTTPQGYASPIDLFGDSMVGVDYSGRPIYEYVGTNELQDTPYEINLVDPDGQDRPFTAGDLEGVLRFGDTDSATLSRRITTAAPTRLTATGVATGTVAADLVTAGLAARRSLTTHSFRIPMPGVPFSIVDRMATRMGGYNETEIRKMLPFEVLRGGKMNLNRLWGNDANTSGTPNVVDDLAELSSAETIFTNVTPYSTAPTGEWLNDTPGYNVAGDATLRRMGRHLYARHLFVLMMLLMDERSGGRIDYRIANPENISDTEPPGAAPHRLLYKMTARRIAQWAVNVVDFRDPDAIMTAFEYDPNPFDGWSVDGDPNTVENSDDFIRDLVWGCEFPDVLLTESFAMHDRRVRDTAYDDRADIASPTEDAPVAPDPSTKRLHPDKVADPTSTKIGDEDLDQVRIPQGSLFLEFYCARQHSAEALSGQNAVLPRELYDASGRLELGRVEPETNTFPVWRVAISVSHHTGGAAAAAARNPNSPLVLRGSKPDSTTFQPARMSFIDSSVNLPIERYLWFNPAAPTGSHANSGETPENTYYNRSGASAALLTPGQYLLVGPRDKSFVGSKPKEPAATTGDLTMTQRADQLLDFTAGKALHKGVGNNDIYPYLPTAAPVNDDNCIRAPGTLNAAMTITGYPLGELSGLNISEPLPANKYPTGTWYDDDGGGDADAYGDGTMNNRYRDKPVDSVAGKPLNDDQILSTRTVQNYRTAFLQRLANPLLRWNPESGQTGHNANFPVNPYITVDWVPLDLTVFNGEDRVPTGWNAANGSFDPDDPNAPTTQFASRHKKSAALIAASPDLETGIPWTSNTELQTALTENASATENYRFDLIHSLGFLNAAHYSIAAPVVISPPQTIATSQGESSSAFAWLSFANRPFISHHDLMLVPMSAPGRLLHDFTTVRVNASTFQPSGTQSFYDVMDDFKIPFGHTLNFYHAINTLGGSGVKVPHYYRLFDFVEVPSRFEGTQQWYSPSNALVAYRPPFHGVSKFRDPGVVNVNTIAGTEVWRSVMGAAPTTDYFSNYVTIDSTATTGRRGTPDGFNRFGNSFRGSWSTATTSDSRRTLLRGVADGRTPLIQRPSGPFIDILSRFVKDARRHNQVFLEGILRAGNLVDKQSNVYAIWVTVGYFEVNENGILNGREVGQDLGEVRRHRGFYIFDRSLPVAYQRGQDHNVERAVLLRRYIE